MKLASELLAILVVLLPANERHIGSKNKWWRWPFKRKRKLDATMVQRMSKRNRRTNGWWRVTCKKSWFRHPKEHKVKHSARQGTATTDQCYGLLGMKWTGATESYVINLKHPYGISSESIAMPLQHRRKHGMSRPKSIGSQVIRSKTPAIWLW